MPPLCHAYPNQIHHTEKNGHAEERGIPAEDAELCPRNRDPSFLGVKWLFHQHLLNALAMLIIRPKMT